MTRVGGERDTETSGSGPLDPSDGGQTEGKDGLEGGEGVSTIQRRYIPGHPELRGSLKHRREKGRGGKLVTLSVRHVDSLDTAQ